MKAAFYYTKTCLTVRHVFVYIPQALIQSEDKVTMYFTNGDHRAFESFMRGTPGSDHYDSGADSRFRSAGAAAATGRTARIGTASTSNVPIPQVA